MTSQRLLIIAVLLATADPALAAPAEQYRVEYGAWPPADRDERGYPLQNEPTDVTALMDALQARPLGNRATTQANTAFSVPPP